MSDYNKLACEVCQRLFYMEFFVFLTGKIFENHSIVVFLANFYTISISFDDSVSLAQRCCFAKETGFKVA